MVQGNSKADMNEICHCQPRRPVILSMKQNNVININVSLLRNRAQARARIIDLQ